MADIPSSENTNFLKRLSRMSIFGLGLHSWEHLMLLSLAIAGLIAVAVFVTTTSVVLLQRREAAQTQHEFDEYKLTVEGQVAAAKQEGIEAGKAAGNAILRAAELEKEAANARLETERLKKEVSWRDVMPSQATELAVLLIGKSMQIVFHWGAGDAESSYFAHRLAEALTKAGQQVMGGGPVGQLGQERHGLLVAGYKADEVQTISDVLTRIGLGPIEQQVVQPPATSQSAAQYTDIFVGYRVPPKL
jgi:hypothetical protein